MNTTTTAGQTAQITLAQALYCLNKQAKALRDEREELKASLFENANESSYIDATGCGVSQPWEDEKIYIEDAIRELNHAESLFNSEDYDSEEDCCSVNETEITPDNLEEEKEYYYEALEKLEANNPHKKLKVLQEQTNDLYRLKSDCLDKLIDKNMATITGYHTFGDYDRDCIEYDGFTFHADYCESDNYLGDIDDLIESENKLEIECPSTDEIVTIITDFLEK